MALYYAEFSTTPANLLADLNTQIANCTDWTRPNAGSRPNTWKATTTRGADMVLDFNAAAPTVDLMTIQAYLSYDGTTLGTAAPTRYLRWTSNGSGAAASKPLRCVLSLSKEHLYLEIEGPRTSEAGTDGTTFGSFRRCFYIGDLVPYFSSAIDPNPAVVMVGHTGNNASNTSDPNWYKACVSKTIGGQAWQSGWLASMAAVASKLPGAFGDSMQRQSADGNYYLAPFVYVDDVDGWRGRLNNCYFAGWSEPAVDWAITPLGHGSSVTYSSTKYRIRSCYKTNGLGSYAACGPFGYTNNDNLNGPNSGYPNYGLIAGSATAYYSPLVAVPST